MQNKRLMLCIYSSFIRQWIHSLICNIAVHVTGYSFVSFAYKCSPFNANHFSSITNTGGCHSLVANPSPGMMVCCRDSNPESERINTMLPLSGINPQIDHLLPCSHMSFLWSAWHSCTESILKNSCRAEGEHAFPFFYCAPGFAPRHVQTAVYEESKLERKSCYILFNHKEPELKFLIVSLIRF